MGGLPGLMTTPDAPPGTKTLAFGLRTNSFAFGFRVNFLPEAATETEGTVVDDDTSDEEGVDDAG
jgi:hypothetical protein